MDKADLAKRKWLRPPMTRLRHFATKFAAGVQGGGVRRIAKIEGGRGLCAFAPPTHVADVNADLVSEVDAAARRRSLWPVRSAPDSVRNYP